jgi:hypothetical protein
VYKEVYVRHKTLERTVNGTMNHDWPSVTGLWVRDLLRRVFPRYRKLFHLILFLFFGLGRVLCLLRLWPHLGCHVLQLELSGQLEVELNRSALELALQRIRDCDVDFRSVECAITGVQLPCATSSSGELVESLGQLALSLVPRGNIAQEAFGTGAELELEREAELSVHLFQELE